jgi:class 3 adenylate cyclase/tetratricopeptide (TPR) repeat protein
MKCSRCQHENEASAKFCEECAAPLARACPKCGRQLSTTAKFCPECAHPTGVSAAPSETPRFGSPESYTPRHLAEKILTSKAALEGERKQVTVLFADLKGSMELLADRDPEEARKILDPVLERMMEAVHHYEGTVNQVMGDGIMALFGAPLAHEDHAVRACYAALRMQENVKKYADELRRAHGADVKIRVGLNSGEVLVRAIRSDLHMDYTAVGQTTHLAARMEQLAEPGAIAISPETFGLVEGYIEASSLGAVAVKGLAEPVEIYEVTGAGQARTRLQAAARRGLTRFVGRHTEMQRLCRTLRSTAEGHSRIVGIEGEAGVGKSRLIYELTRSDSSRGWLVLHAGAAQYGKAVPYLPIADLLSGYFAIDRGDDLRARRQKVVNKLAALDHAEQDNIPALLSVLDAPAEDAEWSALTPVERRGQILAAISNVLARESQRQPVLVVIEDLQCIDSDTQSLLDLLLERLPDGRVCYCLAYRPEYHDSWSALPYYTHFRLEPFPAETTEQLLDAMLGGGAGLISLKAVLSDRAAGNPFFLEESVQSLIDTGSLVGERGAYRLAGPVPSIRVPTTVHGVLAARIDRLRPQDKAVLQTAAVIGNDVPLSILKAVLDDSVDDLRAALGRLQSAEFVYEAGMSPGLTYIFKHALTHEVASGSLSHDRRRVISQRVVEAIEQLYADGLVEQVEPLAQHAFRGEQWSKAATYLRQAAAKAQLRAAYREAVGAYEQALTALSHLTPDHVTKSDEIDVCLDLSLAFNALAEYDRAQQILGRAEQCAALLGDDYRLAAALSLMSVDLRLLGDYDGAIRVGQQAVRTAAPLGDTALEAWARFRLSHAYYGSGDLKQAVDHLTWVVDAPADGREQEVRRALARGWLAMAFSLLGQFQRAREHGEEALRVAQIMNRPMYLITALSTLAFANLTQGNVGQAITLARQGLAVASASAISDWAWVLERILASAVRLAGHVNDALEHSQRAVELTPLGHRAAALIALSEAYLAVGRKGDAWQSAKKALALSDRGKEYRSRPEAMRLVGELAGHPDGLDRGDVEMAVAAFTEALALALELGMRPLVAHCHLGLGKLDRRTDKQEQAHEHLTTATTMYHEMGMTYWLEKAEAEMQELG